MAMDKLVLSHAMSVGVDGLHVELGELSIGVGSKISERVE